MTEDQRSDAADGLPRSLRPEAGREIELKLVVPGGDLALLKQHALVRSLAQGRPVVRRLRAVYYDTPERDLAREQLALRVRRSGRTFVQTLKSTGSSLGGLFVRGEWEARTAAAEPDLERIPAFAARALARRVVGEKRLEPVFETEFRRTSFRLRRGDTELSLDFDEGEIRACGRSAPIRELELELVRGDAGVLHGIALELHETVPLRPALESKAERGIALASGARPAPRHAARIALAPGASVEDAVRTVFAAGVEQLLANLEPARDASDLEGVHQLRVALRRARAALALFRDLLPAEQVETFRAELRWLASECGPARDFDVFLAETLEPLAVRFAEDASMKQLRDAARELRDLAYERVRSAVDSPRCGALCLALGGWLTASAWRSGASAEAWAEPARERGAALLEARFKKARKLGRALAERTASERHRLRIELKKLRYAGEFLGSLYREEDAARMLRRLSDLQDTLGALNDAATAERLLERIAGHLGREWGANHERAAGFVIGWMCRGADRRLGRLERQWKVLRRPKPFWRA